MGGAWGKGSEHSFGAERAVGDAVPDELVLAGESERPVSGPGGDDDGLAEVLRPRGDDGLDLAVVLNGRDLVELQLGAVVDRLIDELFAEQPYGL